MDLRLLAALIAGVLPLAAAASNGLNLIGFGTESVAMGGADTAVARDTTALNTNPAGLGQLMRPAFDGYMAAAFALDVGHADSLGNNRRVDNKIIPVGGFGISRPYADGTLVAAVGLFAQVEPGPCTKTCAPRSEPPTSSRHRSVSCASRPASPGAPPTA